MVYQNISLSPLITLKTAIFKIKCSDVPSIIFCPLKQVEKSRMFEVFQKKRRAHPDFSSKKKASRILKIGSLRKTHH